MRYTVDDEETGATGVVATFLAAVLTVVLTGILLGYALGLPFGRATCLAAAAYLIRGVSPRFWSRP